MRPREKCSGASICQRGVKVRRIAKVRSARGEVGGRQPYCEAIFSETRAATPVNQRWLEADMARRLAGLVTEAERQMQSGREVKRQAGKEASMQRG